MKFFFVGDGGAEFSGVAEEVNNRLGGSVRDFFGGDDKVSSLKV